MSLTTAKRFEQPNYTAEQVREHVAEALKIVDELDVPDDLRVAAFGKAVDLVAAKQIVFEQPATVQFDPRMLQ